MIKYSEYQPTNFDCKGLNLENQQSWLVMPCGQNRDSDALQQSNFRVCLEMLGGESNSVEVCNFGHWACGWFEIIIINPENTEILKKAEQIEADLEDYPVLDEQDFYELEGQDALDVWQNCYSECERIEYIRQYRSEFEFQGFGDLLQCVRGIWFGGYESTLLY